MGLRYLWDTNTAIYYLQRQFPSSAELFIDNCLEEHDPAISTITEIELLCWRASSEEDLKVLRSFVEETYIFELEKEIKLKTIEIRRANKIKLPDAIVGATAMVHDLTLFTGTWMTSNVSLGYVLSILLIRRYRQKGKSSPPSQTLTFH